MTAFETLKLEPLEPAELRELDPHEAIARIADAIKKLETQEARIDATLALLDSTPEPQSN